MKRNLVLVYQAGIANVFAVNKAHASAAKRETETRVYQGDFRTAEAMIHGAWLAGARVHYAFCNQAGDIARRDWDTEQDSAPFADAMRLPKYGSEAGGL